MAKEGEIMSPIHLLWIVPLAFWAGFGFALIGYAIAAREDCDRRMWTDD
jgi:hypothetical protein